MATGQERKAAGNASKPGLLAWMKLVAHYDPGRGIHMSVAFARSIHPREFIGQTLLMQRDF